jgi:hypothetical protein
MRATIDHARLKEHVSSMPGKLDAPVLEGGLSDKRESVT